MKMCFLVKSFFREVILDYARAVRVEYYWVHTLVFFGINAAQTNHKNRLNYVAGSPDTTKEPYCDDCIISSGYTVIQWLNDRVRAF